MVYNHKFYLKNKEKFLEYQRRYRLKYKERTQQKRKEYDKIYLIQNREKILAKRKEYRQTHHNKILEYNHRPDIKKRMKIYQKLYLEKNRKNIQKYAKEYHLKNKQRIAEYSKRHQQIPAIKARRNELSRIRRRNNPNSNRGAYLELQEAMNNVRRRDKNTCQWQGCGLTFKQASIHVHHIFPRNEYPDWELIEQYMICYCANHHGLWHRYRGDSYSEMINPRYQENFNEPLLSKGRD